MKTHLILGLLVTLSCATNSFAAVHYDASLPPVAFAAAKVEAALNGADIPVIFEIQPDAAKPEAFAIERSPDGAIRIVGSDPAGALYGGLEVAELLRIGGPERVQPDQQAPALGMRGVKFNIPLDARTPSYTDLGESGQGAIDDVWDFTFWTGFIDAVATHRYNYISLWSLHPFPSLVKVPDYPDVALDDVKRAVGVEKKTYDGRGRDFDAPQILDETETLLTLSIDEKIAFWRRVMRYGKDRNVDFYIVTWNIFDYGTEGKYGIDDSITNPITADYFRKSVTQLFLTYPDLRGIGLTAGENMHDATEQEKEDWALKTYGLGVLDVFETQPERQITFLHRQHEAGAAAIADTFQPLLDHPNVDFIFSYKYALAHAYSAPRQPFYRKFAQQIENHPAELKTIWTMRNDSTYLFRWAAPSFMREFVQNIPMDLTRGYYFGSDGWTWGREFIRKGMEGTQLEISTHWYQWMLWGRLAYDPSIGDERFAEIAGIRFPAVDATALMDAWQKASMVFPLVNSFHWGQLDFRWYPEACIGVQNFARTKTGFHDVNRFITLRQHPGSGYLNIPDYVKAIRNEAPIQKTTPLEVAATLLANANDALAAQTQLKPGHNSELAETLKDIEAMALLSRYYGHKITGATHLHFFREGGDPEQQTKSIDALEAAAQAWQGYAANIVARFHQPMWLARIRTGPVDYAQISEWVNGDIAIAQNATAKQ